MIKDEYILLREVFEAGFLVTLFVLPGVSALLITQHLRPWETRTRCSLAIISLWTFAGSLALGMTGQSVAIAVAALGILLSFVTRRFLPNYYVAGPIFLTVTILSFIFGDGWSLFFILTLPITWITRSLLLVNLVMLVFTIPLGLITLLPAQSYLFRKRWHRPRHPLPPQQRDVYPRVSFHVPCYAEPPELVCATLNALSHMRYPNFEVVVVDNNTKDPNLWRPVEHHCAELGSRFHFFHVDPLSGAKAGALNFALRHTAPDAEIIAIIDADYQAEPDFLERLVGFFDDPAMGYVQTPHDYRGWERNRYQRACYWEYVPHYRLGIASLSEWVASYIIGTMCLVRRSALEEAGGWAEWCLTEDSECAIRIHALGYSSIFLTQTFGRGLIPENFWGYKKQRLRWTIGPIQQLKRHWRLFLPAPFGTPSQLTAWQRLFEFSHSLQESNTLFGLVFLPIAWSTIFSIIYHQEIIRVPLVVWVATAVTIPCSLAVRWLTYRLAGCFTLKDMMGATIASLSLIHVRLVGSLIGWFSSKPPQWRRTNKFKIFPNRLQALKAASTELLLGIILIILGCLLAVQASYCPPDVLFLVTLGLFLTGIAYLAAPLMSLLAEHQLRRMALASLHENLEKHDSKIAA
jgi:cellulose synthase/poly-beta-1,6-N-acetylglucosamine synthase-like glycosyltransferase